MRDEMWVVGGVLAFVIPNVINAWMTLEQRRQRIALEEANRLAETAAQGGRPMNKIAPLPLSSTIQPWRFYLPIVVSGIFMLMTLAIIGLDYYGLHGGEDPRDLSAGEEAKFVDALAQSVGPTDHFYLFCVSDDSCAVAMRYRDRLARAGWKNLPDVDPIATKGVSLLTYSEKQNQPSQAASLARAFEQTHVTLNWNNGSGQTGTTIGSTGPAEERATTVPSAERPPTLLKGPRDFALIVGDRP